MAPMSAATPRPTHLSHVQAAVPRADKAPLMRRYAIWALDTSGDLVETTRIAPAIPVFENAFSAFARGTLITTREGPVAVEDLQPGMKVVTLENGYETLQWLGSITRFPDQDGSPTQQSIALTRITAESLGYGRPAADLMLGAGARLMVRDKSRNLPAFGPARSFEDGFSIFPVTPMSAVSLYHLAFTGQRTIIANGMEVESYHPGLALRHLEGSPALPLFRAMFPHVDALSDFGPLTRRQLTAGETEELLLS